LTYIPITFTFELDLESINLNQHAKRQGCSQVTVRNEFFTWTTEMIGSM